MKEFGIDEANMFEFWDVSNEYLCFVFCDRDLYQTPVEQNLEVSFFITLPSFLQCMHFMD